MLRVASCRLISPVIASMDSVPSMRIIVESEGRSEKACS
jgi:hypothetical protein